MREGLGFVPFHYIGLDMLGGKLAGSAPHLFGEFVGCKFHLYALKEPGNNLKAIAWKTLANNRYTSPRLAYGNVKIYIFLFGANNR